MTRVMARLSGVHHRVVAAGERGTTMVELLVAMVIMTICGAIFTTAVVSLSRTTNQAQAISNAAGQNNQAFQTLDRTVRYAVAITSPGVGTDGNWYVELRTTNTGTEVCTQLRIDKTTTVQQLQSRSWTVSGTTTSTPTAWTPLASGVTNGGAASGSDIQPFVLPPQSTTAGRQRLQIYLVSRSGPPSQPSSSTSSFTLTAVNSTSATPPTTPVCQQVGRPT